MNDTSHAFARERRELDPASPAFEDLVCGLLSEGIGVQFAAQGTSMNPFIRDGDLVTVEPLGPSPVRMGHVVLFRREPRGLALHRVIAFATGGGLQIRGDASSGPGESVQETRVLGRATTVTRGHNRVSAWRHPVLVWGWASLLRLWASLTVTRQNR
jgi:hypothetical protein